MYDKCPNCFLPLGGKTVCPNCDNDLSKNKYYSGVLPPFTVLNNRYIIGRVLGKGGFGVTYKAKDTFNNTVCAIKEYMPTEHCSRSEGSLNIVPFSNEHSQRTFTHGRERFLIEAQTLATLRRNPNVVDIYEYFEQNNTAYFAMEYLDGMNLREIAVKNGGRIETEFMTSVFLTVASALMEIHNLGIMHRDLSPDNIIVTKDGIVKLIDFGAAKNYVRLQNKGSSVLLKIGYSPPEQYDANGHQGPWGDVYALCATYYTLVSGKTILDSMILKNHGAEMPTLLSLGCSVPAKMSSVIRRGMELEYRKRYQNFKQLLDDVGAAVPPTLPTPPTPPTPPPPPRKKVYVSAIKGSGESDRIYIEPNKVFHIGRLYTSQIVVEGDNSLSRDHCYLRYDGNNIYLCDRSSHGTFFENGSRLIKNNEYIVASGTRFYLVTRKHMFVVREE